MNLNDIVSQMSELSNNLGIALKKATENMTESEKAEFDAQMKSVNSKKVISDLEKANKELAKLMNNGA